MCQDELCLKRRSLKRYYHNADSRKESEHGKYSMRLKTRCQLTGTFAEKIKLEAPHTLGYPKLDDELEASNAHIDL